ncbi:hypothetical protein BHM03_00023397 [Ensete ventricosum]|nr:hypothetical protein BHM03_00023397 [Ensete ventricosum]
MNQPKVTKAPISLRSTIATPNAPRQQQRPRQTLIGSRLSIKAGDPKLRFVAPPPRSDWEQRSTSRDRTRACPNQRYRGPNPLCCFPFEPSSGSIAAHLLPPTTADLASAASSKPRSHRLSLPRGSLYRKPPVTTAQCRTLARSLRH